LLQMGRREMGFLHRTAGSSPAGATRHHPHLSIGR
jgi:hypothetical protein